MVDGDSASQARLVPPEPPPDDWTVRELVEQLHRYGGAMVVRIMGEVVPKRILRVKELMGGYWSDGDFIQGPMVVIEW